MMQRSHRRVDRIGPALAGAATAGLGTVGFAGFVHWSMRTGTSYADSIPVLLTWIAIGVIAGLVSRRYGDAVALWAGASIGAVVAALAIDVADPSWPKGDSPFELWLILIAAFLLPFVAGGHLLGVAVAKRILWRPRRATAP